jgi:hypothetical protein
MAKLKEGDKAPDFAVTDGEGNPVTAQRSARQKIRAVLLSQGRHARLHERSLFIPRLVRQIQKTRYRSFWRLT